MYSGATVLFATEVGQNELCRALRISEGEWNEDELVNVALCWDRPCATNTLLYRRLCEMGCPNLRVFSLPCCMAGDNPLFLGVYLGDMSVAYRDIIQSFEDIGGYLRYLDEMLDGIKARAAEYIGPATAEICKLLPNAKPKVYTFANDCDSCT